MDAISPGLAAHKGLRGDILLEVKKAQPVTAKELADRFGVSANAVRRHLKELEAEGLIAYVRQQRGTGAPTYAYRLSQGGETLFPNRYEEALTRLLRHIVDTEGRGAALSVLEQQYADLRGRLDRHLGEMTPVDRVKAMAGVLEDAGYLAESAETDGELRLRLHHCAIRAVASNLPEVCDTELRFLEESLGAGIRRRTHIVDGCNACEYAITFAPQPPAAEVKE